MIPISLVKAEGDAARQGGAQGRLRGARRAGRVIVAYYLLWLTILHHYYYYCDFLVLLSLLLLVVVIIIIIQFIFFHARSASRRAVRPLPRGRPPWTCLGHHHTLIGTFAFTVYFLLMEENGFPRKPAGSLFCS